MNTYYCHLKENWIYLHKMHTPDSPKICSAWTLKPHNRMKFHKFSNMGRRASFMFFLSVCHHKAHRDNGSPQNGLLQTWKQFQPPGKASNAVHKARQDLSSSDHPGLKYYYTVQHLESTVIYYVYVSCMELCSLRHTQLSEQTDREAEREREFVFFLLYTSYFGFFFLLCLLNP